MPNVRRGFDASKLPDVAFGSRDLVWWGTMSFVVIEGFTLVLCAVVWIYLSRNEGSWPPQGTPFPLRDVPTAQVIVMLLSLPLMVWLNRVAERFDYRRTRAGLTIASLFCLAFVILRYIEVTKSLNVKWNTNAYGSAQWLVVCAHGTLLLMQLIETSGIALAFWAAPITKKHFSDASDVTTYWYFMVASWIPLYVLCFLVPNA